MQSPLALKNYDPLINQSIQTPGKVKSIQEAKKTAKEFTAQFLEILLKDIFNNGNTNGFLGDSHTADTLVKPQWISVLAQSAVQGENGFGLCKMIYQSILKNSGLKDEKTEPRIGENYHECL